MSGADTVGNSSNGRVANALEIREITDMLNVDKMKQSVEIVKDFVREIFWKKMKWVFESDLNYKRDGKLPMLFQIAMKEKNENRSRVEFEKYKNIITPTMNSKRSSVTSAIRKNFIGTLHNANNIKLALHRTHTQQLIFCIFNTTFT